MHDSVGARQERQDTWFDRSSSRMGGAFSGVAAQKGESSRLWPPFHVERKA